MELGRRQAVVWLSVTLLVLGTSLLWGLAGFGVWDPWELETAERARRLLEQREAAAAEHPLSSVVALGFALFGVREWAGRLPLAVAGIATVWLAYLWVARSAGRRAGVYAAVVTGSTPLLIFNSRSMLGEAPAFVAHTLVALCAAHVVWPGPQGKRGRVRFVWLGATAAALAVAAAASGVLLGALPPLLAAATFALLRGAGRTWLSARGLSSAALVALGVILCAATANHVWADAAHYSVWLGGQPASGQPPTFDFWLERVFHAFAPWSVLLPVAAAGALAPGAGTHPDDDGEEACASFALLWIGFGFAAHTVFSSRYGLQSVFLPVVGLAALVAIVLRRAERNRGAWGTAIACVLLTALLLRDFLRFAGGPVEALPIAQFEPPQVFKPRGPWLLTLGAFALSALFAFAAGEPRRPDMRAPYRLLREQWRRGLGFKLWLGMIAALLVGTVVFGLVAWLAGRQAGLPTIAAKAGRTLLFVPVAIPLVTALAQWLRYAFERLGDYRFVTVLLSGLSVGLFATHGYMPAVSAHMSPREVYTTYNRWAGAGEVLAEYKVSGRAAAYYAEGEIREIEEQSALIAHLTADARRWAVFPSDELAPIDRAYRQRTGEHLFVADAESGQLVLAANRAVEGAEDHNPLREAVRSELSDDVEHSVEANLDGRIVVVGYDLALPHGDYVGAGESFTITWYFRVLEPVRGRYKVFVHIDGHGLRLNGDHEPVDGAYPVHLWNEGDVIVDEQRLTVPANFRPGDYSILMGFFSGSRRLPVVEGEQDGNNRIRAGVLRIR